MTGEAVIKSICWTTDIDYFLHMNNAKYLKELDFARFDYYFRTGLWELFKTYPGMVTAAIYFSWLLCSGGVLFFYQPQSGIPNGHMLG